MLSAFLVCTACLALDQPAARSAESLKAANLAASYEKAKREVGRNPDDHVRLALWCEAHQMETERQKHLTIALLKEPGHAAARGLMGLVNFRDRWSSPEAVSDLLKADASETATRAEYGCRRARMNKSADDHWKMALWCDDHGLKAEATAHLTAVRQLDPSRDGAWKRLGYKRQAGRWLTTGQIADEKAKADAQRKADKHWMTVLTRWRDELGANSTEADATQLLAGVTDPRAARAVWAIFGTGNASRQKIAVQVLGQIDSTASTCGLVMLAVAGESGEVRSNATQTLRRSDPRGAAAFLVTLLREPELDPDPILYHYMVQLVGAEALGSPGVLHVRGPHYDVLRYYTVDDSRSVLSLGIPNATPSPGYPLAVRNQTQRQANDLVALIGQILRESEAPVAIANDHVRRVNEFNARVVLVLGAVVGKDLGKDREAARKWWTEEQGYAYRAPAPSLRQDWTLSDDKPTYADSVHTSCFAADTPVYTLDGPRPIQSVEVGDQVLSQDPKTGILQYQPVTEALHNKPAMVLKIKLQQDVIKATDIHRFWRAGQGWVMARDLKPGDRLRALGGVAEITAVENHLVLPVFNLKVLNGQTFFAGSRRLLVHDSSLVEPVTEAFDAVRLSD